MAVLVREAILLMSVAGVALVGLAATYLALRHGTLMLALVLAAWVLTIAVRDTMDISLTVAGFRVSALDGLVVPLAVVGVARMLNLGIENVPRGLALGLLFLIGVHLVRGISGYGLQTAVSDARGWLYFGTALVYTATVPGGWDARIWKLIAGTGLLLAAIAVPYFLIDGLQPSTAQVFRSGEWTTARPVVATGALLILEAAIIAPSIGWPSRRASVWAMLGAGLVLVLLQHRTLWVAAFAVASVAFVLWSAKQPRAAQPRVFAATGLLLLALPVCLWGFTHTGSLVASTRAASGSDSTLTWRTTSWQELIGTHHSSADIIFGGPSGANWDRLVQGRLATTSPHNDFVDAYLRFGIPGAVIFTLLGFLLWRHRRAVAAGSGLTPDAVSLVLLAQFVFCITYNLDVIQGIVGGLFVSGLTVAARARAVERSHRRLPFEHGLAGT